MDSLGSNLVAFQWNFNQGAGNDTLASPSFIYHAAGNVNAQLVAGNSNGCSDTLSYQFSLLSAPNAAFSISNFCEQSNLQLMNTSSSNDTSSLVAYSWNFGDGTISTLATPYHAYAQEGTYLVALVCAAGNSCSDTLVQSVSILPKPDLIWTLGPACKDNLTVFESQSTIPSGTLDSTSWLVNLQFPFHGTSGSYVFTTFGIQYLHLHTVSDLGCPRDTLILVDVQPGVSSAFNFEPISVLAGDTVTLTSQSSGQSGQSWWVNQQFIGNQSSAQLVVGDSLEGQTLQASLIVENALGCTDTAHLAIQVNERTLEIEVKQVFHSEINGLHQVGAELVNLGTVPISRAQLYLSLTGQELLSSYVSDTILPGNSFYYVFPSAPNFSSLNQNETGDFYCVTADLEPFYTQKELDLTNNQHCAVLEDQSYALSAPYPNPANDQSNMTLVVNETSTLSLEVINTLGQKITRLWNNQVFEPGTYIISLDMTAWASGIYFIDCNNGEDAKIYRILKSAE
jgi:PKD repeat protein